MSFKSVIHLLLDERRDGEAIFVPFFVFYLIITKLFKTRVFHVSVGVCMTLVSRELPVANDELF